MPERLALLDKNRKAVLALPNAAFKLWMCHWMAEDDEQESYLSQPEIRLQTNLSVTSIVNWTQWLVRHGWLVSTGKTAFEKLLALGRIPSHNSKQVKVYRVDDPTTTKNVVGVPLQKMQGYTTTKFVNKVSCSGSGFDSSFDFDSASNSWSESDSGLTERKSLPPSANAKPEPEPTPKPTPTKRTGQKKQVPEGFDTWSLEKRLAWSDANKHTGEGNAAAASPSSLSTKQTPKPEPDVPADASVPCMFCNFAARRSPTSDYCADCWARKQRGEKLVPFKSAAPGAVR